MITRLSINGLAIIDELSIEFNPGFNVITGETGAGKSILIKGLNLLLGGKASSDAVRKGKPQATVLGEFLVPVGHPALAVMERLGLAAEKQGDLRGILIRRQVSEKGRSQAWVNDTPVTGGPLRELGRTLVDIFGQHENQRLMDEGQHLAYLDGFLPDDFVRETALAAGKKIRDGVEDLRVFVKAMQSGSRDVDFVKFRLEALEKFAPSAEDYEKVSRLSEMAGRVGSVRDALREALALMDGEEGGSPPSALRQVARLMEKLKDPKGDELNERASQLAKDLDDLSYELGRFASSFDLDDGELEEAQSRHFGYQDLFRKHGARDINELLENISRLNAELDAIENSAGFVKDRLNGLEALSQEWLKAAGALSRARRKVAASVKKRVELELEQLSMPGSILEVEFFPAQAHPPTLDLEWLDSELHQDWLNMREGLSSLGEKGAEDCRFLLSSNPGEPVLPMSRVASGGELSRIMLALKKALVADAETCVLVFDEVDAGISGRVADVVGRKMQELASGFQVLCISHLPQVAVYGDSHFKVEKRKKGGRTESFIVALSREETAREIARLLSGEEVSAPSLANARSLMEKGPPGEKTPEFQQHP